MMTLTALLEKPGLNACLDDLLASRFFSKRSAGRIRSISELPFALQCCAKNLVAEAAWRAYGEADRVFFAVALPHVEAGVDCGLAIDAYFMDENAGVYSAGVWAYDRAHGWWLDAVLDLSYDCERGWWSDALVAKAAPAMVLALPAASRSIPLPTPALPPTLRLMPLIEFRVRR